MTERIERVIHHPLHRQLGVRDARSEDGHGFFRFTVGDENVNPAGALHGGVIYLLCDVCAYLGLLSVLQGDTEAVTHDMHVSVMRAGKRGEEITMASRLLKKGKTLCFIEVTAKSGDQLLATARVTKSLIPVR